MFSLTSQKKHDIHEFVQKSENEILNEYKRIRKIGKKDSGTAGDQGETNWKDLLVRWLPSQFQIVTKGRILFEDGEESDQVDVIVLSPHYPRFLLSNKYFLAGGVVAAFECKNTLKAEHILNAVKTSAFIKSHLKQQTGSPHKELNSEIIFGLLAHSHSWNKPKSKPLEIINHKLYEADSLYVTHPIESLDYLCVPELASWLSFKMSKFLAPKLDSLTGYSLEGNIVTSYMMFQRGEDQDIGVFNSPIGLFLGSLYEKISWRYVEMQRLSSYFTSVNLGSAKNCLGSWRPWPLSIYSKAVHKEMLEKIIDSDTAFDEWKWTF